MNTLIGLGTTSAFLYSLFITLFPSLSIDMGLTQKVYFESIGLIISFVYLGKCLEEKAKKKTTEALNSLIRLSSKTASFLVNGNVREVPIERVQCGDTLRVKPGEKFPVDGEILRGYSAVDESMVSGEFLPVNKGIKDQVFAGTINGESVIDYKATKVGQDTFLSQIIAFVEQAQSSKPEIQKYADKISSLFIPAVIIISVLTLFIWFFLESSWGNSVSNFIAVLVIACPCALGLATPTAVVVATGRASLKGILIAGGEVIEKAVDIDTIVFDKTGTLTEGKPSVIDINLKNKNILSDVASIERFSEHPLSKAITHYAQKSGVKLSDPDEFKLIKGKGLKAKINHTDYIIGNESLLRENEIELSEDLMPSRVGSYVFIASKGIHQGTIVIGDKIKEFSQGLISNLKKRGIEVWMLTGDNERIARDVSEKLGIDHYMANIQPLGKSLHIEKLQNEGKHIAMVGDGMNDAPALVKSHLSIAMGTGSDVSINASDITIVNGNLSKILEFVELSKTTMSVIKQNLFLSMAYNVLLIPIAAGGLAIFGGPMMPPVLASIAMALSSLSVVSNSLRIKVIS